MARFTAPQILLNWEKVNMILICALLSTIAPYLFQGTLVREPETETDFPMQLTVEGESLACTGTAVRQVYGFDVYALAHYADPADAPKQGATAKEALAHWIDSSHSKAMKIHFVYSADKQNMRERAAKALATAGYDKEKADKFLAVFARDYPSGSEVMLLAKEGGTLKVVVDGKDEGTWQDAELIRALWSSWLGEASVLKKREGLVTLPESTEAKQ